MHNTRSLSFSVFVLSFLSTSFMCVCVCMYKCMCVYLHVCMCVCMYHNIHSKRLLRSFKGSRIRLEDFGI